MRTLHSFLPWILGIGAMVLFHFVLFPALGPYPQSIILIAGISVVLATSLTLVNGFTGQFSLGHAGFMAVGAYCSAAMTVYLWPSLGWAEELFPLFFVGSLASGGLLAACFGYLVGLPSLRLRGDYLAIVTLGFGEIIRVVLLNMNSLGGARGLSGIPTLVSLNPAWILWTAFLSTLVVSRYIGTPSGRAMLAVREDEVAAEAMGVNTTGTKVKAFVMGSFWAGVAGGLYAHYFGYLNPGAFGFMKSFEVVVIIVLGGLGSVSGAVMAAIALTILPEALRDLQKITGVDFRMIIYSLVLILFMLLRPNGLLGRKELPDLWRKWRRKEA
jgi:branched-chain amino acid transport system permease protein